VRFGFLLLFGLVACGDDAVTLDVIPDPMAVSNRVATVFDGGCVRTDTDELACWEEFIDFEKCTDDLVRIPARIVAQDVRGVALSGATCVHLAEGVKCWGDNNHNGNHGQGDTLPRGSTYFPEPNLSEIPFIDLGPTAPVRGLAVGGIACALFEDGRVKCWGGGSLGLYGVSDRSLGDDPGEMGANLPYVDLGAGARVTNLDTDGGAVCAVLDDGRLKCWGLNNEQGRLGTGDTRDRRLPADMGDALPSVDLGGDAKVVDVGVGREHTCAVLSDGGVKCWGRAFDTIEQEVGDDLIDAPGRLGYGDMRHRGAVPEEMGDNLPRVDLGSGARAVAVDLGRASSCALLSSGDVKCWGNGATNETRPLTNLGSIGDEPGEMGDALLAMDFGGRRAVGLAVQYDSACAVLEDGTTHCWGVQMEPDCPIVLP
jgi:hypothetical protein